MGLVVVTFCYFVKVYFYSFVYACLRLKPHNTGAVNWTRGPLEEWGAPLSWLCCGRGCLRGGRVALWLGVGTHGTYAHSVLSFNLYVGSRDQTRVTGLPCSMCWGRRIVWAESEGSLCNTVNSVRLSCLTSPKQFLNFCFSLVLLGIDTVYIDTVYH